MEITSSTTLLTKKEKKRIQARVKIWARERKGGSRTTTTPKEQALEGRVYRLEQCIQVLEGLMFYVRQEK